jgi:hypothetical protein
MTALETAIYFGRLKGMTAADAAVSARSLLDRFGLSGFTDRKVEQLSKGMAQKVQLAAALVTGPRLLILDEPFSGLDPVNQAVLEEVVQERAKGGGTVIFSTHVMQHAERLCDRLLLLARGRKVFQGDQDAARAQLPTRLTLTARDDPRNLRGVTSAEALGPPRDGWTDWAIMLAPGGDAAGVLEACTGRGFALRRFEIEAWVDGAVVHRGDTLFASVLNTRTYGSGMPIATTAGSTPSVTSGSTGGGSGSGAGGKSGATTSSGSGSSNSGHSSMSLTPAGLLSSMQTSNTSSLLNAIKAQDTADAGTSSSDNLYALLGIGSHINTSA